MTEPLIARLLLANKLATKNQINQYQTLVTPDRNIAEVLLDQGILSKGAYQKVQVHLKKLKAKAEAAEDQAIEEPKKKASQPEPAVPEAGGSPEQPATPPVSPNRAAAEPPQEVGSTEPVQTPKPAADLEAAIGLPAQFIGHSGRGTLRVAIPSRVSPGSSLDEILLYARNQQASDLHLNPNQPIGLTRVGKIVAASQDILTDADTRRIIEQGIGVSRLDAFRASGDASFVHAIDGGGRYRITLMKTRDGWSLTARIIPDKIRTLDDSNLPESCVALANLREGLVLVTGSIGCGKTSTMATLVNHINHTRAAHIITIEDLVEVVYENARCQVTQREIGLHCASAPAALIAALRQDPDVLVISELPDLAAIKVALSAAETGHLVFSTMNTTSASRTIYRLIDSFPPDEQGIIRNRLAQALRAVVSQHLIPKSDGSGVVPAFEVLMISPAIANLIRKGNTHLIGSAMLTGKAGGMVLLDDSLQSLVAQGTISGEEAYHRAINAKLFQKFAPALPDGGVDNTLSGKTP